MTLNNIVYTETRNLRGEFITIGRLRREIGDAVPPLERVFERSPDRACAQSAMSALPAELKA